MPDQEASIGVRFNVDQQALDHFQRTIRDLPEDLRSRFAALNRELSTLGVGGGGLEAAGGLLGRVLGQGAATRSQAREFRGHLDDVLRSLRAFERERGRIVEEGQREIAAMQERYSRMGGGRMVALRRGEPGYERIAERVALSDQINERLTALQALTPQRFSLAQREVRGLATAMQGIPITQESGLAAGATGWEQAGYVAGGMASSAMGGIAGAIGIPMAMGAIAYAGARAIGRDLSQYDVIRRVAGLADQGIATPEMFSGFNVNRWAGGRDAVRSRYLGVMLDGHNLLGWDESARALDIFSAQAGAARTPMYQQAARLGMGFGVGAEGGAQFFGAMARMGVTTDDPSQRRFAVLIGEAVVQGQMRGMEGEVLKNLQTYLQVATATSLRGGEPEARGMLDLQLRLIQAGEAAGVGAAVRGGGAMRAIMGMQSAVAGTELFPNAGQGMLVPLLAGIALQHGITDPVAMQGMVEGGIFGRVGGPKGPMLYQELLRSPLLQGPLGPLLMHQAFGMPTTMARLLATSPNQAGLTTMLGNPEYADIIQGMMSDKGGFRMARYEALMEQAAQTGMKPEEFRREAEKIHGGPFDIMEAMQTSMTDLRNKLEDSFSRFGFAVSKFADAVSKFLGEEEPTESGGGGDTSALGDIFSNRPPTLDPRKPRFWLQILPARPPILPHGPGPTGGGGDGSTGGGGALGPGSSIAPSVATGYAQVATDSYNDAMNRQQAAIANMRSGGTTGTGTASAPKSFKERVETFGTRVQAEFGDIIHRVAVEMGMTSREAEAYGMLYAEGSGDYLRGVPAADIRGDFDEQGRPHSFGLAQLNLGTFPNAASMSEPSRIEAGVRHLFSLMKKYRDPVMAHRAYRGLAKKYEADTTASARMRLRAAELWGRLFFQRPVIMPPPRGDRWWEPGQWSGVLPPRMAEIERFGEFTPIPDIDGSIEMGEPPLPPGPMPPWLTQLGPLGSSPGMGYPVVGAPGAAPVPDLYPWETRETGARGGGGGQMGMDDLARAFAMNIRISIDPLTIIVRDGSGKVIDTFHTQPHYSLYGTTISDAAP